ncbi:uncharacterized protein TEOVI_000554300 [Trypanosoma equiperdum]|uniref:Uncharacterized protein n=1 Tax=Trypanosoma equiperdum TaxID=5694 RepID=A0A1G4I5M0_TRYEQ|nr:hypothetical protein, conserved [Trypanosoma equiperdum]
MWQLSSCTRLRTAKRICSHQLPFPIVAIYLRHFSCSHILYGTRSSAKSLLKETSGNGGHNRNGKKEQEVPGNKSPRSATAPPANARTGVKTVERKSDGTDQSGPAEREEPQHSEAQIADEERRLVEGDTRLAMRMLMQHYFLYQSNSRRPEDERLEEERERLREKHRARMERIENKTRNSMELGAGVAVDGILPLYSRRKSTGGEAPSISGWRRLNPVEAEEAAASSAAAAETKEVGSEGEADECDDHYDNISRMCNDLPRGGHLGVFLAKPDITAYDAEHDRRIRSAEVLEAEERCRKEELLNGPVASKVWSKEELEDGGGLTPMRVVQSQMLEDEDEDFAVEAYEIGNDE